MEIVTKVRGDAILSGTSRIMSIGSPVSDILCVHRLSGLISSHRRVISCNSPYGEGGIGQHFTELVEEAREAGELKEYFSNAPKEEDDRGRRISPRTYGLLKYTPLRFSPTWKNYLTNDRFDRAVASRLETPVPTFMGFAGKSLRSFRRARQLGCERLELVVPNSHVENVYELHKLAYCQTGIRDTWLNRTQVRKTLKEYEMADTIYVHSDYVADSLVSRGVSRRKLLRTHLSADERFEPPHERPSDETFRIVYVGRIDATKGIPLLLNAFRQLPLKDVKLRLVGGWSTRGMRKYMERWLEQDPRITAKSGDPKPVLQQADVLVHPTFEDGFGYAPMEALACGVPAIVTEDTGMKEYIVEGRNGYVVPTGNTGAIIDRILQVYRRPLARTSSLLEVTTPASPAKEEVSG